MLKKDVLYLFLASFSIIVIFILFVNYSLSTTISDDNTFGFASYSLENISWSDWLNRDIPNDSGDYEIVSAFSVESMGCDSPIAIECRSVGGILWNETDDVNTVCTTEKGFVCKNVDQNETVDGICGDYEVRFGCEREVLFFEKNKDGLFYVDNDKGNDLNDGSITAPWKTIRRVNEEIFLPGEKIFFKRDGVWNEPLIISSSGLANNVIYFGAYGEGNDPEINLAIEISDWKLFEENLYVSPISFNVSQVFIDGERFSVARDPNNGFHYLNVDSSSVDSFVVDDVSHSKVDLIDAEFWARLRRWYLHGFIISDVQNDNIILNSKLNYPAYANTGYLFLNKLWMLDSDGEWYYDANEENLYVYHSTFETSKPKIAYSSSNFGVILTNVSNVVVENLVIYGAADSGIDLDNTKNISIYDVSILNAGFKGINLQNSFEDGVIDGVNISDSFINNSGFYGFYALGFGQRKKVIFENNVVSNTMDLIVSKPGLDMSYWGRGSGVLFSVIDGYFKNNTIDSSGYSCVILEGENNLVEYNLMKNCCLLLDDGGGIYIRGFNHIINNNIIINVTGNNEGFPHPIGNNKTAAQGIYPDALSHDILIHNNTVVNTGFSGYQTHNSYNLIIKDNVFYNNSVQLWMQESLNEYKAARVENNVVSQNIFFSFEDQIPILFGTDADNALNFGFFDKNIFSTNNFILQEATLLEEKYYSLLEWKKRNDLQEVDSIFDFYDFQPYTFSYVDFSNDFVVNGDFIFDKSGSSVRPSTATTTWVENCALGKGCLEVVSDDSSVSNDLTLRVSLSENLLEDATYVVNFSIVSETDDLVSVYVLDNVKPYPILSNPDYFSVSTSPVSHEFILTSKSDSVNPVLFFATGAKDSHYWIKDISLKETKDVSLHKLSSDVRILINTGYKKKSFSLTENYCGVDNAVFSDVVILNPFTSVILLSCFCNNDGVCNNRESACSCENDCPGSCVVEDASVLNSTPSFVDNAVEYINNDSLVLNNVSILNSSSKKSVNISSSADSITSFNESSTVNDTSLLVNENNGSENIFFNNSILIKENGSVQTSVSEENSFFMLYVFIGCIFLFLVVLLILIKKSIISSKVLFQRNILQDMISKETNDGLRNLYIYICDMHDQGMEKELIRVKLLEVNWDAKFIDDLFDKIYSSKGK